MITPLTYYYPFQLLKKECVKMVSKKIEMIGIFIIAILFSMILVFGAINSFIYGEFKL